MVGKSRFTAFGDEALKFFNDVARSCTPTTAAANAFKAYWTRRIATAAQRAFGALLRGRLPGLEARNIPGLRMPARPHEHIINFPNAATIAGAAPRVHFDPLARIIPAVSA